MAVSTSMTVAPTPRRSSPASERVLVVEDDLNLGRVVVRGLRDAGFTVEFAPNGFAGLERARSGDVDVIVLDIGLPDIDGIALCRRLRADDDFTPVLMLTARGALLDRVAGLDAGADDYLPKPFSILELSARLRALLRRRERHRAEPLVVGPLRLDPAARRAWRDDTELELSPREFALLEALVRRKGEAVSRGRLLDEAWDRAYEHRSNVVDVYVRMLREKLDRPFDSPMLTTVRGIGYRLDAPE
jgi:two-component system, OmpR family, response regulator